VKISPSPSRFTIRTVLVLGFGLTLGLWLFSGYYFSRRVAELQRDSARVTDRYVRAQASMSAVRSQVLLASVYVRDALLDPNPESIVDYRLKLDEAITISNRALSEYEPVIDNSSESVRIGQLRDRIDEFRVTVFDVLGGDSTKWQTDALLLLRDRIMPKREEAVQVSDEVQELNRSAYIDQQSATSALYRATQQRIWTQFGLAVIASFCIGLTAIRRVATLEKELRVQQERDARNSADLQRLSAQLISAQEDERRTIARELHDEVGQALTAIKVELAVAERMIQPKERGGPPLSTARTLTESALHTVRDLSRLLHPAVLDDIGLSAAIDMYVREFRKRYDISVEFTVDGSAFRLPSQAEAAAYRIVQEALTNVARHAHASTCRIVLRRQASDIQLTIEDDGVGFDPEAQRSGRVEKGLGLLGMQERVSRLGGSCIVDSAPGNGTRVTVRLPLDVPSADADAPADAAAALPGSILGRLVDV